MKILLISNMYPSNKDIFYGIFVKNFENSLLDDGVLVDRVSIDGRGKNKVEKIYKYVVFFKNSYLKLLKKDYDLVYVHYGAHPLFVFWLTSAWKRKPLVINMHGDDTLPKSRLSKLIKNIVTPIVRKASLIVAPSKNFAGLVISQFKIPENKLFISPSGGINTSIFKPFNVQNKIFTIGYVSRIDEGKGWKTFIKAVEELLIVKDYNIKVLIIGSGLEEDTLIDTIDKLNIGSNVEYLGSIQHSELFNYFNQMDLFVFPTELEESLGLVGLEAMACGLPVVGSKIGGLQSYIKSGYNGEFFEPGNYQELCQKIEYFFNLDETQIIAYKKNALETSVDYDSFIVNRKLKKKLYELIEKVNNETFT